MPPSFPLPAPAITALAMLALALSGCAGDSGTGDPVVADPCLVTSATDTACMDEALNATAGGASRPHLHDYWNGATRLPFEDMHGASNAVLCTPVASVAILRPADGEAVIQGTGTVEVTLTFDAPLPVSQVDHMELWVKTAADIQARPIAPIASGETILLPSNDTANDLPHQLLSAWEFHLVAVGSPTVGCWAYNGPVAAHVEIVRGTADIPLYPGHPDRWDGATSIALVDLAGDVTFYAGGDLNMCLSAQCPWDPIRPADGAIVPYDAATVTVTLEHLGASPARLALAYHGADSRELELPTPDADSGTLRSYTIPVAGRGDGPYATQSQWEIRVLPENEANAYTGQYRLTATVNKGV